jgi:endonuclease/exonuclease/phosphatase (EEP) superfamily protein YafD
MIEDNDRIDLSPLDPTRDSDRFDATVRSITTAAANELVARRSRADVFGQVARWWWPLLAAAVVTGVVSLATLAQVQVETSTTSTETEITIAEAIGVPQQLALWIESDEMPSSADLLLTLEDDR